MQTRGGKKHAMSIPHEAFVHVRIGEVSEGVRRIEINGGSEWWVHIHDETVDFDEAERTRELKRILLVFNCGHAEISSKQPSPKLVPIAWESKGHYRFVGRIGEVIECEVAADDNRAKALRIPPGSVYYEVILDAEVPLWCHFWAKGDTGIGNGSVVDVSGELLAGTS